MKKIGIVGHSRSINIVSKIISSSFSYLSFIPIPLNSMDTKPVINYIKANEQNFDGLLFTGIIPYNLLNTQMVSEKPWGYIHHDTTRLLSALLEACVKYKYDISHISIDSYSKKDVLSIYQQLNLDAPLSDVLIADYPIHTDDFLEQIKLFHKKNYETIHVSCCITGISSVYEYLSELSIPCIILDPTRISVESAIKHLQDKYTYKKQSNNQIVVMAIERDLPDAHALIRENEYQLALESMKVAEEIYLFSQRIQAAVIENELGKFLLFTTKYLFEIETEDLQKINILSKPIMQRFSTISIGIGYGDTAREAKYYANLGLLKAKKCGGNQAFKVEHNEYLGPIVLNEPIYRNSDTEIDGESQQIDGEFQQIALKSGISINNIIKLQSIMDMQRNQTFTPSELASLFGISHRSINRLLEKLIHSGYAKIVGCNMQSQAGRPSRVVKIDFGVNQQ